MPNTHGSYAQKAYLIGPPVGLRRAV